MIKSILVPTDGSDHAGKAVELAADIAAKYDAQLVVFHALMRRVGEGDIRALCTELAAPDAIIAKLEQLEDGMVASATAGAFPVIPPVPGDVLYEIGSLITDRAAEVAKSKGVKNVKTQIVDAAPAEAILAAVDAEGVDMIVMGNRGLGKIAGLIMGSVSHKISNLAPCTCVTVK